MYKDKEHFKELIGRDLTDIEKQNLLDAMIEIDVLMAQDDDVLLELEAEVDDHGDTVDNLRHDMEVLEEKLLETEQKLERYKDIYGELN